MASARANSARITLILCGSALLTVLVGACQRHRSWHATDLTGSVPNLNLSMTRANDGRAVSAEDYRGKVTMLYFGYTYCPDVCPMTLANAAHVLKALGSSGNRVRVLFVTVDPNRDTLPVLKRYAAAFDPRVDALRGTSDELAALARRYRVAYAVESDGSASAYQVMHSSGVYMFDGKGKARLLVSTLSTDHPDIEGTVSDLRELLR